jgi:hypothetical protein
MGYRIVYDPAITVEHYPQPRADETRDFNPNQVRDAAHNETLALLDHLEPAGRVAHLVFAVAVGTRTSPGLARSMRALVRTGTPQLHLVAANLSGRRLAVVAHLRARHDDRKGVEDRGRRGNER